jgi:GntR family transcriptional regulator, transcriptional repressor for pyruvate dehydrogenase complex
MAREKMLADKVADSIYKMIKTENKFEAGEKLPNENEMAKMFGVSRTTLRESVKILATAGVLEIKRGRGTFVSKNIVNVDKTELENINSYKIKLVDLFEVRLAIEPEVAFWAAQRATDDEIAEIEKRGLAVEKTLIMHKDRTDDELLFHKSIAEAAHNEFMIELLPMIFKAIERGVAISEQITEISDDTLYDHRSIVRFLKRRDAEGARTAMRLHLIHAMCSMRE